MIIVNFSILEGTYKKRCQLTVSCYQVSMENWLIWCLRMEVVHSCEKEGGSNDLILTEERQVEIWACFNMILWLESKYAMLNTIVKTSLQKSRFKYHENF